MTDNAERAGPASALSPERVKRNLSRHLGSVGSITDACTLIDRLAAENAALKVLAERRLNERESWTATAGEHAKAADRATAENARLRIALHDAIRRPLGVTPDSATEFYDPRMADEAEARRPRLSDRPHPTAPVTTVGEEV